MLGPHRIGKGERRRLVPHADDERYLARLEPVAVLAAGEVIACELDGVGQLFRGFGVEEASMLPRNLVEPVILRVARRLEAAIGSRLRQQRGGSQPERSAQRRGTDPEPRQKRTA